MDNEKLFDFMSQMYSEMKDGFKEVKGEIKEIKKTILTYATSDNFQKNRVIISVLFCN